MKILYLKNGKRSSKTPQEVIDYVEENGLDAIHGIEAEDDYNETAKVAEYLGWVRRGEKNAQERILSLLGRDITLFDYKYEQGEITREQLGDKYADEIEEKWRK